MSGWDNDDGTRRDELRERNRARANNCSRCGHAVNVVDGAQLDPASHFAGISSEDRPMTLTVEKLKARWTGFVEARHGDWTWRMLEALYSEPHRCYHNLTHVAACLDLLDVARHDPRVRIIGTPVVELALFFHDAVYVPGDKRNEELSANLLRSLAPIAYTVHAEHIEHAAIAVLATKHHETVADDIISQLTIDIDLSILGSEPVVYDSYVRAVRQEFAAVSDDAWRVGRSGFLLGMLAKRSRIYQTTWGHETFDALAHENMRRELSILEGT